MQRELMRTTLWREYDGMIEGEGVRGRPPV